LWVKIVENVGDLCRNYHLHPHRSFFIPPDGAREKWVGDKDDDEEEEDGFMNTSSVNQPYAKAFSLLVKRAPC
jgi:hypothetical protein